MKQHLVVLASILFVSSASGQSLTFETHVRPILKAHCFECHGDGKKPKGLLDVRLRRLLVEGGANGPSIVPGDAGKSMLIDKLRKGAMPPGKRKLTKTEIATIERWIDGGAKTAQPEPATLAAGFTITAEERAFWAFQPIKRPESPATAVAGSTPIDAFLLQKLKEKNLTFSPEADGRTLIRRLSFDLIGLPPTPQEIDDFVNDRSKDAYEKLVTRLLASPHYGERWGRHWLDIAGYADSEGYASEDALRKSSYRYRDYVVRSFNADKPFDQFIIEQLAGDELVKPPYAKLAAADLDKLIATGFLRMAPDGTGSKEADMKVATNQMIADTLQIVSTSLLGLTVQCAQCHNHRYDPIPQVDYYRMRAIFEPALDWKNWRTPAAREVIVLSEPAQQKAAAIEAEAVKIDQQRLKKEAEYIEQTFNKELAKLPLELQDAGRKARNTPLAKRSPSEAKLMRDYPNLNVSAGSLYLYDGKAAAELKTIQAKAVALRATKPAGESIRALTEIPGKVPTTHLFDRGDHEQPKEAVTPGHLTILNLGAIADRDAARSSTGRRLAFARSLVDGKHPLTARVIVNRVWMEHFGKGLVNTPADLGFLGERPSHPELLDWLASEFMTPTFKPAGEQREPAGWSLKHLHRLIVTSQAYRQTSTRRPELDRIDPENRLLGRMSLRRLDAEAVRDAVLAVSGKLSVKQFGPPVPIMFDELGQIVVGVDTTDGAGRPTGKVVPLGEDEFRRSLYVQVRRTRPLGVLETFDGAAVTPNCEMRNSSTVTPQALLLMNSRFVQQQADFFARRVQKEAGKEMRDQVSLAWRLAFGRQPEAKDVDGALAFVTSQAALFRVQARAEPETRALANFCQALLSANAFLYVD